MSETETKTETTETKTETAPITGAEVVKTAKTKPAAKKAKPSKKPAAKKAKPSKKPAAKKAKPSANLSKIDLDKLKSEIGKKGGTTVPALMKTLRQPRINVARAIVRLSKLCKVKSKRADHVPGKPGQRPFVYTLG